MFRWWLTGSGDVRLDDYRVPVAHFLVLLSLRKPATLADAT